MSTDIRVHPIAAIAYTIFIVVVGFVIGFGVAYSPQPEEPLTPDQRYLECLDSLRIISQNGELEPGILTCEAPKE